LRSQHRRSTRTKVLVATVGAAAAATAAIVLPQAYASSTGSTDEPAAALRAAQEKLRERPAIPGTAWVVDPRTSQMVVTADATVAGDRWNALMSTVRLMGDRVVRVERSNGEFRLYAEGGDAIFAGGARCSLGFNVTTRDNRSAFLTAGHCGVAASRWSFAQNARPAATVQRATFPGNGDFALVTYDNRATRADSAVDIGGGRTVRITKAADAKVGQRVSRMGSTTGLHNGRVTALDATVNYPEGTVTGLVQTTVCAEGGDSGGPLFTQDGAAIGVTSGGSGDCRTGGVTFFQPVTAALTAVGARIAAGADTGRGNRDSIGG
jgi:streptogrisin D